MGPPVTAGAARFRSVGRDPDAGSAFPVGADQHVLVIVVHHIAFDGWSMAPMVRDVGVAYAARCRGRAPGWAPLPVQYVGLHVVAAEHWVSLTDPDSLIAGQVAYWGQALAGLPERLHCRRIGPSAGGRLPRASEDVEWPAQLRRSVARVAREHNATASWCCRPRWRC